MNIYQEVQGNIYSGDGTTLAAQNLPFWARVTSFDGVRYYGWQEHLPTEGGGFVLLDGGRSGVITRNPLYEPNSASIMLNSFVQLKRAYFSSAFDWVYLAVSSVAGSASGALEVKTVNPGTGDVPLDITGVAVLQIDQGSGLRETNPSGTIVRIAAQDASPAHSGVVTTGFQSIAGGKTFDAIGANGIGPLPTIGVNSVGLHIYCASGTSSQAQFVDGSGSNFLVAISDVNVYSIAAHGRVAAQTSFSIATAFSGTTGEVTAATDGLTTTIAYLKDPSGAGTLTFTGGILTGFT